MISVIFFLMKNKILLLSQKKRVKAMILVKTNQDLIKQETTYTTH
jgi:hypothetical protein